MGYLGKNAATLAMSVSKAKRAWLVERVDRLGVPLTISEYTAAIVDQWINAGCPPVWPIEKHMEPFPFDEQKWEKAVKANPNLIFPKKQRPTK